MQAPALKVDQVPNCIAHRTAHVQAVLILMGQEDPATAHYGFKSSVIYPFETCMRDQARMHMFMASCQPDAEYHAHVGM